MAHFSVTDSRVASQLQVRFVSAENPSLVHNLLPSVAAILLQIKLAISNLDPRPARLAADWQRCVRVLCYGGVKLTSVDRILRRSRWRASKELLLLTGGG